MALFGAKGFLYAVADCSVMAKNMMLAAHTLGIGSCMVMRAEDTFPSELGERLIAEWGLDERYEPKAFVTLGYPEGGKAQAKPRKEGRIIRA